MNLKILLLFYLFTSFFKKAFSKSLYAQSKIQADPTKNQFSVSIFLVRRGSENANPAFRITKNTAKTTKTTRDENNQKTGRTNHVMALTRKAWRIIKLNYLNNESFVYPANTVAMQPIQCYNRRQYWRGTQILLFFFKLMELQPVGIGHCCTVFSTPPCEIFSLHVLFVFFSAWCSFSCPSYVAFFRTKRNSNVLHWLNL